MNRMSMRKHGPTERRRQRADLDQLGDSTTPVRVGLNHVDRVRLQELEKPPAGVFVFTRGDRNGCGTLDRREVADSVWRDGFFQPSRLVVRNTLEQTDDVRCVATHEAVEHDLDVRTDSLAHGAYQVHVVLHAFEPITRSIA